MEKQSKIYIISLTIIIITLLLLLIIGYNLFSNYSYHQKNKNKINNVVDTFEFEGRSYEIPLGWKFIEDYEEYGEKRIKLMNISENCGAIIGFLDINDIDGNATNVLKDPTIMEKTLKNVGANISNGKTIKYGNTQTVVFQFVYAEKMGNALLAYMKAYDNYLYVIRFTSGKIVDGQEEMYYDYEKLEEVINILSTGKKE